MAEQAPATQVVVSPVPEVQALPGRPQLASVVTSSSREMRDCIPRLC